MYCRDGDAPGGQFREGSVGREELAVGTEARRRGVELIVGRRFGLGGIGMLSIAGQWGTDLWSAGVGVKGSAGAVP